MIYRKRWQKRIGESLLFYIRDCFVQLLPFKLPDYFRKKIYGENIKYIFIVHARRKQDIFIALPFLRPIRNILPKKLRYRFLQSLPPFTLGHIKTTSNTNGLIVTTTKLPEKLFYDRRVSSEEIKKCIRFASKISDNNSIVGLGGWWPIVTGRGVAVSEFASKRGLVITNGHTGTLCSIYLMLNRIAEISGLGLNNMSVLVMGIGKMGQNVIRSIQGKVSKIELYDMNYQKSLREMQRIKEENLETQCSVVEYNKESLIKAMVETHVTICTASNMKRILKEYEVPENVIIVDDSRPEAFSRALSPKRGNLIIEGGLLKIVGCKTNYHFGFGINSNVFGCLAESYLLACDNNNNIKPSLGIFSLENFNKMLNILNKYNVCVGDFRCSNLKIFEFQIKDVLNSKAKVNSFMPNQC